MELLTPLVLLEAIAVIGGLIYVVLAAREHIGCWPAALVATGASILLLWQVNLYMDAALNGYYFLMAIYGFWQWRATGPNAIARQITAWPLMWHAIILLAVAAATLVIGYFLSTYTQAAWPYIDTATTLSAFVATFMVAYKVLENWLYWVIIDAVSVWIYVERGLNGYAVLFLLYTVIAIWGYVTWRSKHFARLTQAD